MHVNVVDIDLRADLVQRYDELVPVLMGCRDGAPDQQLCHYFLDENAVKSFFHPLLTELYRSIWVKRSG